MTLKILVLDDEPGVGRIFERVLAEKADVLATSSPEAALALAVNGSFDVIVCDLHMPRISGIDFYHQLVEKKAGVEQDIIFLTGGLYSKESQEFMDSVDNQLLLKPFVMDDLMKAINYIVD